MFSLRRQLIYALAASILGTPLPAAEIATAERETPSAGEAPLSAPESIEVEESAPVLASPDASTSRGSFSATRSTLFARYLTGRMQDPNEEPRGPATKKWPNIREPGPDMGDFPNSSYTLPKGRVYIESAPFTMSSADRFTPAAYSFPFLFRYGITDDVEFRFLGNGFTGVGGSQDTTGVSPMLFDLKVHLWDAPEDLWLPASSLEVYIQTDWASPHYQGGTQPSVNMNFDLPLNEQTNFEWTIGYTGVQGAVDVASGEKFIPRYGYIITGKHRVDVNRNLFAVQWALEREVTERLQLFVHGYYNGATFLQQGAGSVIGLGGFWTFSDRLMGFGSCNAGLDNQVSPLSGQVGFALAL
jgi:hypothetical protein